MLAIYVGVYTITRSIDRVQVDVCIIWTDLESVGNQTRQLSGDELVTLIRKHTKPYQCAVRICSAAISLHQSPQLLDSTKQLPLRTWLDGRRKAKICLADDVDDLLTFASVSRHPLRNRVIVLLSAKAGLRAGEIAQLTWDMVVDGNGRLGDLIELRDCAAKRGGGRRIPIHPDLGTRPALEEWRQTTGPSDHVIRSERGGPMTPLGLVQSRLQEYWAEGMFVAFRPPNVRHPRRSRGLHAAGGSLRDVQLLASHASVQTTQQYIDGDSDAQRKLVAMI